MKGANCLNISLKNNRKFHEYESLAKLLETGICGRSTPALLSTYCTVVHIEFIIAKLAPVLIIASFLISTCA